MRGSAGSADIRIDVEPAEARQNESRARGLSIWKKLLFAAISVIGIFGVLEGGLWVADIETMLDKEDPLRGFSRLVSVFEREGDVYRTRQFKGYVTFNDESFLSEKPKNGLRIFCLGGSSTYGFPWDGRVAFTAILGDVLAEAHPERQVEAINVGGISYAMHRLRIVADEIINYEPDVLIIYSGHNEFVESAFYSRLRDRSDQLNWLQHTAANWRLYSLVRRLWSESQSELPPQRLELFVRREDISLFTPAQKMQIVDAFGHNLRHIVRQAKQRGAKVVLATTACNLSQWIPNASVPEKSLDDEEQRQWISALVTGKRLLEAGNASQAATSFRRAAQIGTGHAETHYWLGKALERLGEWDEARRSFQIACDVDASPNRRLSMTNDVVRQIATEETTLLVDVDKAFEQESENGLIGLNLFDDFVHPNQRGQKLIAWLLWDSMERDGVFGRKSSADPKVFARVVAARPQIAEATGAPWFSNQGTLLEQQGHIDEAMEKYRKAMEISPSYDVPRLKMARLHSLAGDYDSVLRVLKPLLKVEPLLSEAHNHYGVALRR